MTTIRQLLYKTDFYWKGDRYRQLVRVKDKKSKAPVLCYKLYNPYQARVEMPLGRTVKPVIKFKLGELNEL